MITILYISHSLPPKDAELDNMGGMQRVSMQLLEALKSLPDVDVVPITLHAKWKHINIKTAGFLFDLVRKLPKLVHKNKADVVLFSSMVTASLAPFFRKTLPVPMVTINHGQDVTMPIHAYQKYVPNVFKALSGVISVSEATKSKCVERGMPEEKGIALPNGFDSDWTQKMISRDEANEFLRKEFHIPEDHKILLTVGRLVPRKGHAWFTEKVFPKIEQRVSWIIIGDGPEYQNINELAEKQEFGQHIILAGRQPDEVLYNAYAGSDLFVMPNIPVQGDMEGFGIVMLEAGLAGTPSIASDLEGIKDVIQNGVNGFKIKPEHPNLFAKKIDDVLNEDMTYLRERTSQYVNETFGWEQVSRKYVNYLKLKIAEFNQSKLRRS